MKPSDLTRRFRFVVVERGQTFGDTIIAIHDGHNLIWQGKRKDWRAFLQDEKAKQEDRENELKKLACLDAWENSKESAN